MCEEAQSAPQSLIPEIAGCAITARRLTGEPHGMDTQLRAAFAWWRKVNTPNQMVNGGATLIDMVAHLQHLPQCGQPVGFSEHAGGCRYQPQIPPGQIDVATAVILHLFGTSVGWADLQDLLSHLGFELAEKRNE